MAKTVDESGGDSTSEKFKSFGEMTVAQLRTELKKRGARLSGTKDVLLQRLTNYERNNNFFDAGINTSSTQSTAPPYPWPTDESAYKSVSPSSVPPNINSVFINSYFLRQYSSDGVGLSEFHSVNSHGYTMAMEKFLAAMTEVKDEGNSVIFYRGQVNSEMTKALTYFVRVCVQTDGRIVQSECECSAGKGPAAVCKHVAVICYCIEHFKLTKIWLIRTTVTQKKQLWHAPKNIRLNVSPKKAEHLPLTVQKPGGYAKEKNDMCFDPRSPISAKVDYNARARSAFLNFTNHIHGNLGISTIFSVASTKAFVADHDYLAKPFHLQQVYNRIHVTQQQAEKIEELTRRQGDSKLWHIEREIRITASKVGEICHFTDRRDQEKFAHDLVVNGNKQINTEAVLWGKLNEPKAVKSFEEQSHNKVRKCGLHISLDHHFLAATPDGLVAEVSLLEVKCPFSIKDEFVTPENYPHVEYRNGELCLKKTSNYYYQVQTQLYCAKKDYCFFYIWTLCGGRIIHVKKDMDLLFNVIIPKVQVFYDTYMVPEIQKRIYPLV